MKKILRKIAMLSAPVLAAASLIGLSRAVDPVAVAGWKALAVFSVLGSLSAVASASRRGHVELDAMFGADKLRENSREAA
ncbi:MAG: hypothetical protein EBZ67_03620 [Chitinophagia bacterium]|nr:hypothetical protein [Chitinophagia bacterium]